jgi:GNAT superfamily N-acetyltransferase
MERAQPNLRVARPDDASRVDALMKESVAEIFPLYYDAQQVASSIRHVAEVDSMLLEDGTYFVLESEGEIVACGGWSRRDRLYTGSGESDEDSRVLDPATEPAKVRAMFVRADWTRRGLGRRILEECEAAARQEGFTTLALGATLPGLPLYLAFGFEPIEEGEIVLSDGVRLGYVSMTKTIDVAVEGNSQRDRPHPANGVTAP